MPKPLHLIVACSENRVIGRARKLPFNIPEDKAWFHEKTAGTTVVLGRICFETWPKVLADGRQPVVITSNQGLASGRVRAAPNVPGALAIAQFGLTHYWVHTFWGGALAAAGGALIFGACRRLWRAARPFLGIKFHGAIQRAKPQPRQTVDHAAPAVGTLQGIVPAGRAVAIHLGQKISQVWTAQQGFDLGKFGLGRLRLGPDGVTCITFRPGWVKTDMGGAGAPLEVDRSVSAMRQTIDGLTKKHTDLVDALTLDCPYLFL